MALVTDAVSKDRSQGLADELGRELEERLSIRVMERSEDGISVFSLSAIINSWLDEIEAIRKGRKSNTSIIILPPIKMPEEFKRELAESLKAIWTALIAA